MMRISRIFYMAWIAILPISLTSVTTAHAQAPPLLEMTSSGLLTFSERDRTLRVAIVFAETNPAVVETIVRFVDARGQVLKTRRGNVSDGMPLIVDLTRSDVGNRGEVLVRAEVFHRFPVPRTTRYPILISLQSTSMDGTSHLFLTWRGDVCWSCSGPSAVGPWASHAAHANCDPDPGLYLDLVWGSPM